MGQPGTAAVQQYNFALRDIRKTVSADTVLSFSVMGNDDREDCHPPLQRFPGCVIHNKGP